MIEEFKKGLNDHEKQFFDEVWRELGDAEKACLLDGCEKMSKETKMAHLEYWSEKKLHDKPFPLSYKIIITLICAVCIFCIMFIFLPVVKAVKVTVALTMILVIVATVYSKTRKTKGEEKAFNLLQIAIILGMIMLLAGFGVVCFFF